MMSNLLPGKIAKITKLPSEYSHEDLRKKLIFVNQMVNYGKSSIFTPSNTIFKK